MIHLLSWWLWHGHPVFYIAIKVTPFTTDIIVIILGSETIVQANQYCRIGYQPIIFFVVFWQLILNRNPVWIFVCPTSTIVECSSDPGVTSFITAAIVNCLCTNFIFTVHTSPPFSSLVLDHLHQKLSSQSEHSAWVTL